MLSTAFDLLVLDEFQYHGQQSLTPNVARLAKENLTGADQSFAGIREELGFHIETRQSDS